MKTKLFTLATLFGLLFAGCQNELTEDNAVSVGDTTTSLTISLEESRTALGEKSGDTYPVYWSEGDRISANGYRSNEVEIDANDKARATFTFNAALNYPLNITYPYTSTTTAQSPKVVFQAEQSYAEGTYSAESAPMCGYVAKKGDKIAQLVIVPCLLPELELVDHLEETDRGDGGFGSTGK